MWLGYAGDAAAACDVTPLRINSGGRLIPAGLYRPLGRRDEPLPIVVFLHGGGWSMGDLECYDGLVRSLCALSGAIFVSIDYRLAPEHKFPQGLEDSLAAMHWIARYASAFGGDAARLAVMGDSAGGNLAAVVAQKLSRADAGKLAAQFLLYPILDISRPHASYPSRLEYGDGAYLLSRNGIDITVEWYLDAATPRDHPEVSPLLTADLGALPPSVILTAGFDPLRDEAALYAARLRAAGVPVHEMCYEETIHAFLSFGVLDIAQRARAALAQQVRRHLSLALRRIKIGGHPCP